MKKYIVISFIFIHTVLFTQYKESDFQVYTMKDGLINNDIKSIVQDEEGFLWISSNMGINRFDGAKFSEPLSINPKLVFPNDISKIKMLSNNRLGICTNDGVRILDLKNYQQVVFKIKSTPKFSYWKNSIQGIEESKSGLYGLSGKTGFYIYDKNFKLINSYERFYEKDIGKEWMIYGYDVVLNKKGELIHLHNQGISHYDEKSNLISHQKQDVIQKKTPLAKDSKYFSFKNHSFVLSKLNRSIEIIDNSTNKSQFIAFNSIISENIYWNTRVFQKNDENYYMNGLNGMYKLYYDRIKNSFLLDSNLYLKNLEINTIFFDKNSKCWIGCKNGLLKEVNEKPIYQIPLNMPQNIRLVSFGVNEKYIYTLQEDDIVRIFDSKSFNLLQSSKLPLNESEIAISLLNINIDTTFISTTKGILLVEHKSNRVARVNIYSERANKFTNIEIYNIQKSKSGDIYFMPSRVNSVYKFNHSKNRFETIFSEEDRKILNLNMIHLFCEDKVGNLWFIGDGVARYNVTKKAIDTIISSLVINKEYHRIFYVAFNKKNEPIYRLLNGGWAIKRNNKLQVINNSLLTPSAISPIAVVNSNLIFQSSRSKLTYWNTETDAFISYTFEDGWDHDRLLTGKILYANNNYFFATEKGIYTSKLDSKHGETSDFFISYIQSGDSLYMNDNKTIILPYKNNSITIQLDKINFDNYQNNYWEYSLTKNGNKSWYQSIDNKINFQQLSPGDYEIELKNRDNKKNKQSLKFKVLPPWYKSFTFYFISIVLFALSLFSYFKYRINSIKIRNENEKHLAQLEMKALQAQMNPHFVFNCLNSIKLLVVQNESKKAASYINKFSALMRSILEESQKQTIEISQSIKHITEYLELEKLRVKNLEYKITVEDNINQDITDIPSMLLQPLVENAIWHGKNIEEDVSEVHIRFTCDEQFLYCEIEDFGIGYNENFSSQEKHNPVGLNNIKKRIALLNTNEENLNKIEFINKKNINIGVGTIVKLTFAKNITI